MTDVLYIVGRGSRHNNAELRWSIASLRLHARNLGRIVVAGPGEVVEGFLSCASCIPVEDDPALPRKHARILRAIFAAIDAGAVRGKFLYSSDDHFLCRDVDLDAYPAWFSAPELPTVESLFNPPGGSGDRPRPLSRPNNHALSLAATRAALAACGYEFCDYHTHANTWMDAADAPEVRRVMEAGDLLGLGKYSYEPTCLFANVRQRREPFSSVMRRDVKLSSFPGADLVWREIAGGDTFSIGDGCFDSPGFEDWMTALYGPGSPLRVAYAFCAVGEPYEAMAANAKKTLLAHVPDAEIIDLDPEAIKAATGLDFSGVSGHASTYARLAIPLLPELRERYDRVVWMDADVEVVSPEFGNIALETDAPLAAVPDQANERMRARLAALAPDYRRTVYYNAAPSVYNLRAIDPADWRSKIDAAWARHCARPFKYRDQDILNLMFEIAPLPVKYNVFDRYHEIEPNPALVHYAGGRRVKDVLMEKIRREA